MSLAIIGAGLAGLSAARALLDAGVRDITVFERRDGPGLETSFANGALLHPSLVEPWNSPGVIGHLLRNLGNEESAALLRLRALPSLIGWGLRFARESSPDCFLRNTRSNLALARYSLAQMPALRASGLAYSYQAQGSLVLFRERQAQAAALAWAERLSADGLRTHALTVEEAVDMEPALAPIAGELVGAVHNLEDESGDAHLYCTAIAAQLAAHGVKFCYGAHVQKIETAGGHVTALRLADGQRCPTDTLVLAAACHSAVLARGLGLKVPVRPAKGYSVTLPMSARADTTDGPVSPRTPVVDSALHIAVVPVGHDRLRVAGTAEFCGFDLSIVPTRVANLMRQMTRVYPKVVASVPASAAQPWAGLRPMTPDGVPLIGATRVRGLFLNTGHGHLGWTLAAGSARLLADLVQGRRPEVDASRFAPSRFGLA